MSDAAVKSATMDGGDGASIAVAALTSAATGFVFLMIVARSLSPADAATFLAYWGMLFVVLGGLTGITAETTRLVATSEARPCTDGGIRVVLLGLAVTGTVAAAIVGTAPLWGAHLLGVSWTACAAWMACSTLAFGGHASLVGILSGQRHWRIASCVVAAESLIRLSGAIIVFAVAATVSGFALAAAAGAGGWVAIAACSRSVRTALTCRSAQRTTVIVSQYWHACLAATSAAILVAGYPVLLRITVSDVTYSQAAPLMLAVVMTRAPIMIPLVAFQGAAIAHFVQTSAGLAALGHLVRILALLTIASMPVAYLIGPRLMSLLNSHFSISGVTLAGLMVGAFAVAVLTLTGAACLAQGRHRSYSAGWLLATGIALLVLVAPVWIDARVMVSLLLGPLVGVIVHVHAIREARGRRARNAS